MPDLACDGLFSVAGKCALVTGAAGGIGFAVAEALAAGGAKVAISDLPGPAFLRATSNLSRATALPADLSDLDAIRRLVDDAVGQLGGLDVLCNVAGLQLRKPMHQVTAVEWQKTIDVNLRSLFFMCQAAAEPLKAARGAVVNFASTASQVAIENISVYSAAKGGIAQLTRSFAIEWAGAGVRVNAVGPGYIETPMTSDVLADPERSAWILERIPMGRLGRPDDLVGPVLFLCSDASRYVTGQVIFVDGGWLAW